jgi:hypothetical protein
VAVFKFSNVSGFKNYQQYNDFLAGNPAVVQDAGAYFPLGEYTVPSAQSTITFSNIPQTYTHLQLRCSVQSSRATNTGDFFLVRFNSDSASNYYYGHNLQGDGASAIAYANGAGTGIYIERIVNFQESNSTFSPVITDILDYKSSNKNKVTRSLAGYDKNGGGQINFSSGLWYKTPEAITTITITLGSAGNFNVGSTFALYGVLA